MRAKAAGPGHLPAIPMAATTFTAALPAGRVRSRASRQIDNVRVAPVVVDRTFHLLARRQ
jgi:hypothetical protein